jgi:hypothetical protein
VTRMLHRRCRSLRECRVRIDINVPSAPATWSQAPSIQRTCRACGPPHASAAAFRARCSRA